MISHQQAQFQGKKTQATAQEIARAAAKAVEDERMRQKAQAQKEAEDKIWRKFEARAKKKAEQLARQKAEVIAKKTAEDKALKEKAEQLRASLAAARLANRLPSKRLRKS
ncbi:hypothetical protein EJG51_002440 [Undibacterium piscinae]|uniref:Uncharacterized protein n=1 Tax=Undibacterium piscinae TaxID=2495591 RepID=A0A6M4A1T6_9BURK|nr:hypothetical protein EJG51_002440 [Undibacterium piscinae]